jgi:hypothetical protein
LFFSLGANDHSAALRVGFKGGTADEQQGKQGDQTGYEFVVALWTGFVHGMLICYPKLPQLHTGR